MFISKYLLRFRALNPKIKLIALSLLCLCVGMFGVAAGAQNYSGHLWSLLLESNSLNHDALVVQARIPRVLTCWLAGFALGAAGSVIFCLTKNPLADTGLLGISSGAQAAIATFSIANLAAQFAFFYQAFIGSLFSSFLIYYLARKKTTAFNIILSGMALNLILQSYIKACVLLYPDLFQDLKYWMVGSASGVTWVDVAGILPPVALAACGLWLITPALNLLCFDRATAISLGLNVQLYILLAWLLITVLAAAATAFVGSLSFLGLLSFHVARYFFAGNLTVQLPAAGLVGGLLLLLADIAARTLLAPQELSVGILISLIGAPFLYIAVKHEFNRSGRVV